MEDWRLNAILLTLVLLHGAFVYLCQSCPDYWEERTLIEEMDGVRNIFYGRIRNKYPDSRYYAGVYTIEVEVYCILKGPKTPRIVNVTEAGYLPTCCSSAEFQVHREYIVLAENNSDSEDHICSSERSEDKGLQIAHGHGTEIIANAENLMEIRKACGLNPVTRPEGSTSTVECPVSDSDCEEKVEPEKRTENIGSTTKDPDYHVTEEPEEIGETSAVASSTKAITALLSTALIIAILR